MPVKPGRYMLDFNPRSREGSDKRQTAQITTYYNFNPRSREGSDDSVGIDWEMI